MALSLVIRGGTVYDGLGNPGVRADVGIDGDRIAVVGEVGETDAPAIDATGLAVSPGFINILSHGWASLQGDGSGPSDLTQGVTTEVFGEAISPGPADQVVQEMLGLFGSDEIAFDFPRLGDGLDYLERNGVSLNVASFIGGHNLRAHGAGMDNRPLTAEELDRVRNLVDEEMADGALGIGTALIYAPGNYTSTDELVALSEILGRHDGLYISHLRSEGDRFMECLDELIEIGARGGCRTELYHLKAAGTHNHHKMAKAIERIHAARAAGQQVGANMYPYTAGGTALAYAIPPAFHAGGPEKLLERLADPATRREIAAAIGELSDDFENLFLGADRGRDVTLMADLPDGTPAAGRSLVDVGRDIGVDDPAEALLEIVARMPDMGACYFLMSEENVELGLRQPFVSLGSDAENDDNAAAGPTHPRQYGTFTRLLGHYRRERKLFPLEEAIRRLTSLPAGVVHIADRGVLTPGAFADLALFDPETVGDRATYTDSRARSVGVHHVVVNGEPVIRDGVILPARPGRRLRRANPHPLITT